MCLDKYIFNKLVHTFDECESEVLITEREAKILEILKRDNIGMPKEDYEIVPDEEDLSQFDIDPNKSFYFYIGPLDERTRPFCAEMLAIGKYFTIEDLEYLSSLVDYNVELYEGGYNCRHHWQRAKLKTAIKNGLIPEQPTNSDFRDLEDLVFNQMMNQYQEFLSYKTVSFSFDRVLTEAKYQKMAMKLMENNKVYILTSRQKMDGVNVLNLANNMGMKSNDVIFTSGKDKQSYVDKYHIDIHYDSDKEKVKNINDNSKNGKAFTIK